MHLIVARKQYHAGWKRPCLFKGFLLIVSLRTSYMLYNYNNYLLIIYSHHTPTNFCFVNIPLTIFDHVSLGCRICVIWMVIHIGYVTSRDAAATKLPTLRRCCIRYVPIIHTTCPNIILMANFWWKNGSAKSASVTRWRRRFLRLSDYGGVS